MHTIKITPNLLFDYQCTSGKFIRLPNRIEKIDSVARIESNRIETFFRPNWNALPMGGQMDKSRYHVDYRYSSFWDAR